MPVSMALDVKFVISFIQSILKSDFGRVSNSQISISKFLYFTLQS